MTRPGRLENRSCVIVGGTGGLGLACARRFRDEGARIVLVGRESEEECIALSRREGLDVLSGDVCDSQSVARFLDEAVTRLGGRLDVLFHAAGISGRSRGDGPLDSCTNEGWDAVLDSNARGPFYTNRAAVRQMITQPLDEFGLRGTILNTGSVLGWSPSPYYFETIAYAASKGALEAMTLAAAARFAPERIRFNLLAPGLIATPMSSRAVQDPAIQAYLRTKQPLSGGPGLPDDCAEGALFLCAPESRFITGVVLTADGGWCVSEGQRS